MGFKATFTSAVGIDGRSFTGTTRVVEGDKGPRAKRSGDNPLPAAKVGQLTTRTDNTTGTLTMAAGHGIVTANRLDVYWTNVDGTKGRRYGVVVGTVATNSVPISGGSGDNLPPNLTAVTAQVPVAVTEFTLTGNSALAIIVAASNGGVLVFREASADALAVSLIAGQPGVYTWDGTGTNPVATKAIVSVLMSQPDANDTGDMEVYALSD
jgi:hypothetical protein